MQPKDLPQREQHAPKKAGSTVSQPVFFVGLAVMAVLGYFVGTHADYLQLVLSGTKASTDSIDLSAVEQTYKVLKANYDGTLDTQKLIDGASRGLTAAAGDRYTLFMDPEESSQFDSDLSGQVTGIGVEVGIRSAQPTVIRVLSGSPAEQSGVKAGDIFLGVNDESVKDLATDQVAVKIRGKSGTTVKVTMKRGQDVKDFTITRAEVNAPSTRTEIKDGIGILTITRFDKDTAEKAREAANQFKQQNVKAVVLDLRDNGGGYADAGRDTAGLWLKDKEIFTERRGDTVVGSEKSGPEAPLEGIKTIVLVNGGSASASEIVAGALQDYGAATLLGEKTYGKGSVQQVLHLQDGRTLKVTVAKWYTPKGKNITKEGITPDASVGMTAADTDAGRDPQLDAAIAKLNQ